VRDGRFHVHDRPPVEAALIQPVRIMVPVV
jgi:hypothetical protein